MELKLLVKILKEVMLMVMVMLIEKVEHFEQLVMKKVEQLKQLKVMEKDFLMQIGLELKSHNDRFAPN